jgi:DNA-binding MarR family transcriptional regulator
MAVQNSPEQLVGILRDTVVALVRRDGHDLSARQLGVFLTVYLSEKPAITRALDRLGELDLAKRKTDPQDRRSVLVQRTTKGSTFLRDIRSVMVEADATARTVAPSVPANTETATRRAV